MTGVPGKRETISKEEKKVGEKVSRMHGRTGLGIQMQSLN
jgi:hypothetical protein